MVLYGPSRVERLDRLTEFRTDMPGHSEAHSVFRRLGEANLFEWRSRDAEDTIEALRREVEAARRGPGDGTGDARNLEIEALLERERRAHAEDMGKVIGQLTQKLESLQEAAIEDRERRSAAEHRLAQLEKELAAAVAHGRQMEALSNDLLVSTSWRITSPLRRAITLLRGR